MTDMTLNARQRPEPPSWYCSDCIRMIQAADALRSPWGRSVAIVCPSCRKRIGEIMNAQLQNTGPMLLR